MGEESSTYLIALVLLGSFVLLSSGLSKLVNHQIHVTYVIKRSFYSTSLNIFKPRDFKRNPWLFAWQKFCQYIKVTLKYFTWKIRAVIWGQEGQMDVECLTGSQRFCKIFRKASRRWMSPYAPLWWGARQDESEW